MQALSAVELFLLSPFPFRDGGTRLENAFKFRQVPPERGDLGGVRREMDDIALGRVARSAGRGVSPSVTA